MTPPRRSLLRHPVPIHRLLGFLLVAVLGVSIPASALAGPWTRSLGEVYVKTGESFYFAEGFVDNQGVFQSGSTYFGATSFAYFEAGIAKRLQVVGYLPYTIAINSLPDQWQYMRGGGADALVGLQYGLLEETPLALRTDLKIPLYDLGSYDGPFAENFPALGDGQYDATAWISYGDSIPDSTLYLFGELGYRYRSEIFTGEGPDDPPSFADTAVFAGQLGADVWDGMILALNVQLVAPLAADDVTKGYLTVGQGVYFPLSGGWALEANIDQTAWARNSAKGLGMAFGVSFKQ